MNRHSTPVCVVWCQSNWHNYGCAKTQLPYLKRNSWYGTHTKPSRAKQDTLAEANGINVNCVYYKVCSVVCQVFCWGQLFFSCSKSILICSNAETIIAIQLNKCINCLGTCLCVTTTCTLSFNLTPHSKLNTPYSAVLLLLFWIAIKDPP